MTMEPLTIGRYEADQKGRAATAYAQVWGNAMGTAVKDCAVLPTHFTKLDPTVCLLFGRRTRVSLRLVLCSRGGNPESKEILLYQCWSRGKGNILYYTEITQESFLRRVSLWLRKCGCQVKQSDLWALWQLYLLTDPGTVIGGAS